MSEFAPETATFRNEFESAIPIPGAVHELTDTDLLEGFRTSNYKWYNHLLKLEAAQAQSDQLPTAVISSMERVLENQGRTSEELGLELAYRASHPAKR